MSYKPYFFQAALAAVLLTGCATGNKSVVPTNLRTEYLDNPIGLGTDEPRFTWEYSGNNKSFMPSKYEIRIGTDPGKLNVYDKTMAIRPHTRYYWNVTAWDESGKRTKTSETAFFETGKLSGSDWSAKWITDNHDKEYEPAPLFRKQFKADGKVADARLYIAAAGYYECFINGKRVGTNYLDPGYTHFDKRILYVTHDVTQLLQAGDNAVAVVLGNGWYNEQSVAVWNFHEARWRNRPRMICELLVEYADGRTQKVLSNSTWRTATGPVRGNVIYAGDIIDARCEVEGWNDPAMDDSAYPAAVVCEAPSPLLVAQQMPPIRESETCEPVSVRRLSDTVYVFSFARNMTGVCTLRVRGEAGTRITMEHGELLRDDGTVEMHNIDFHSHPVRDYSLQRDIFYLRGDGGLESFTPRFHYNGFQYVTVRSDRPVELDRSSLTAHFLHTDVQSVGDFRSSNELLNSLWQAVRRSYLCNLQGIPTDCPHREKNGWTADAHVSIDIGLTNYDAITVYEKWIDDIVDNQREDGSISGIIPSAGWGYDDWIGPVWDAAMFIIPNALYNYYGDVRAIEKIYHTAERYLEYLAARENGDGTVTYGLGDWCFYKTQTPSDFTTTCFYYYDQKLMARFAALTGRDGTKYEAKAAALRELINTKYLDPETGVYSIGRVTAQAVPLALGIVPEKLEAKVAARLNDVVVEDGYTCDFGLLGSRYALRMLVKHGYVETAYRLATQTRRPSWGNWIVEGFTTPLETWALRENFSDSSANHVFFGDIAAWMQSDIAGINYDESKPGFENIVIRPHFPAEMEWAEASYHSVRGVVRSAWHRSRNHIILEVTIPLNTTATIYTDGVYKIKGNGSTYRFVVNERAAMKYAGPVTERK